MLNWTRKKVHWQAVEKKGGESKIDCIFGHLALESRVSNRAAAPLEMNRAFSRLKFDHWQLDGGCELEVRCGDDSDGGKESSEGYYISSHTLTSPIFIFTDFLISAQESTSSDITPIAEVEDWWLIPNNNLLTSKVLPVFVLWGHNYRHWWNHGGEGACVYVRAAFLCSGDQTLPVRHWNQGSEMKLGITESNYMKYKYTVSPAWEPCNCCAITEERELVWVARWRRGRNLIPAHEHQAEQASRLSWGVIRGTLMCCCCRWPSLPTASWKSKLWLVIAFFLKKVQKISPVLQCRIYMSFHYSSCFYWYMSAICLLSRIFLITSHSTANWMPEYTSRPFYFCASEFETLTIEIVIDHFDIQWKSFAFSPGWRAGVCDCV